MGICVFGRVDSKLMSEAAAHRLDDVVQMLHSETILIVPTVWQVQRVHRLWAQQRSAEQLPEVLTMAAFVAKLFQRLSIKGTASLSDAESEIILNASLEAAGERFKPQGLSVQNLVRWKQEFVSVHSAGQLIAEDETFGAAADLERLVRIWQKYESKKGERFLDRGDVELRVIDALSAQQNISVPNSVLVWNTHGLTQADKLLLHMLADNGCDVAIRFSELSELLNAGITYQRSLQVANWLVSHGWTYLSTVHNPPTFTTCVHTWPTIHEEIRRTIGAIKELLSKAVPLDEVCVVLPRSGKYDDQFINIADQARLPISINKDAQLAQNGFATALLAACNVVGRNWRRSDVARLVLSGFISTNNPRCGQLAEAASVARIPGANGWNEWIDRFDENIGALQASYANEEDRNVGELIELFTEGKRHTEWLSGILTGGHGLLSTNTYCDWMFSLTKNFGFNCPEELLMSLDEYSNVGLRHAIPAASVSEHASNWWTIVKRIVVNQSRARIRGVTVGKPHDVRGSQFKYVFSLGMMAGELPTHKSDPINEELLAGLRESLDLEAMSDVLHAPLQNGLLVLSRPTLIDDSAVMNSIFVDELMEVDGALNLVSECGIEVLDNSTYKILIDEADVRAYRDGVSIDDSERQLGVLDETLSDAANKYLSELRYGTLSPSAIDTMIECPYKFYVKRALKIDSGSEAEEWLSSMDRGSMMHSIAAEFFNRVRGHAPEEFNTLDDVRRSMVDLTTRSANKWMPLLIDVYELQRRKYPVGHLYDVVERTMMLDTQERIGILHRWLDKEIELQNATPLRPFMLEHSIEIVSDLGVLKQVPVKLRIDRVDGFVEGNILHCVVIDYKQHTIPSKKDVRAGMKTQLPMYGLAVRQYFQDRSINVATDAGEYRTFGKSLREKDSPYGKTMVESDEEMKFLALMIEPRIEEIQTGRFDVHPIAGVCDRCDVRDVCRIDHWGPSIRNTTTTTP